MRDYSSYSVVEAAIGELLVEFCNGIKILDKEVIKRRLNSIYLGSSANQKDFYTIIAQFNSLISHKTSVDDE